MVEAWEFPSLINPWLAQRERGVEIRVLEPEGWRAPLEQVRDAVDDRTRVLALSHVSYLTGERHDLAAYSKIARDTGALFVVDSSHALGAVPVLAPLADFVFSCCYKWVLGIQGTAIAYWNRSRVPDWRPRMTGWHSVSPRRRWSAATDPTLSTMAGFSSQVIPPTWDCSCWTTHSNICPDFHQPRSKHTISI